MKVSTGSLLSLLFVANLSTVTQALFWGYRPEWDDLKVKFGVNPFRSDVFDTMPRTEKAAVSQGWTKISDCDTSRPSLGKQYVKDNDRAVTLLFDAKGYIAGIQAGLLKSDLPPDYPPAGIQRHILQDEGQYLTLTAYFSDPAIICTSGRTAAMFAEHGTGRNLYIQNGSDPISDSVRIPHEEEELTGTPWALGRCFFAMGNHYWYNVSKDMNCDDFFPVFLLYNEGRLNAFGWALGVAQTSNRFEHPTGSYLDFFFDEVPQCLYDRPQLSTMHIYLSSWPTLNFC